MRATASALAGVTAAALAGRMGRTGWLGAPVGLAVLAPLPGVLAAAGWAGLAGWRRIATARRRRRADDDDVEVLADLLALALGSGLGLVEAMREALRWVGGEVASEAAALVRAVRAQGAEAALAAAGGRIGPLCRLLAGAAASGAPAAAAVAAYAAQRRDADHARRAAVARRLPVQLLVPLALLILPGFVVLAVGPALLDSLARLDIRP